MGIRPKMASIPLEGKVQKVPDIHKAALLCIFLSILRGYSRDALL